MRVRGRFDAGMTGCKWWRKALICLNLSRMDARTRPVRSMMPRPCRKASGRLSDRGWCLTRLCERVGLMFGREGFARLNSARPFFVMRMWRSSWLFCTWICAKGKASSPSSAVFASASGMFSVMSCLRLYRAIWRWGAFLIWTLRTAILFHIVPRRGWLRVSLRKVSGFDTALRMAVL